MEEDDGLTWPRDLGLILAGHHVQGLGDLHGAFLAWIQPWARRLALVAAIGRLGGPAETGLLAPFLGDRDHRVRANAVEALAAIGSEEAIVLLIPALQDPDHRVQANAVRALAGVEGTSIPRLLRALALDGEVWNRDAALHALDSLDAPFALRLLAEVARGDAVPRLRAKARASLKRRSAAGQTAARHLLDELPPED